MDKRSIVTVLTSLAGLIVLGVFLFLFFSREELNVTTERSGYLGVIVDPNTLRILEVRADSSKGKLQVGDRIISVDGKRVSSTEDFRTALKSKFAGDLVQIGTNRGIVPVPLAPKPLRPSK